MIHKADIVCFNLFKNTNSRFKATISFKFYDHIQYGNSSSFFFFCQKLTACVKNMLTKFDNIFIAKNLCF